MRFTRFPNENNMKISAFTNVETIDKLKAQNKVYKEALEFYMKYYIDSRNGGLITTKIKQALKIEE